MRRWSKGRQFRSFSIAVTLDVYLLSLVAYIAAILWTVSTLFISLVVGNTILLRRTPTEDLQDYCMQLI